MVAVRSWLGAALSPFPPLHRIGVAYVHPNNEGARARAAWRVARHEVLTRRLGRPVVVPIGTHSKIIARAGETNSPLAVRANPPNDEMHVWRAHLRPGDLFVDVGANIGIYTVFALDLGAEVIAVEPTARADRVREHLRLNGYEATVLQQALSDAPGTVRMTDHLDSLNHLVLDGPGGVEVPATTLDEVLGDRTAAGVKIDVEGAERLVLQGARRALAERRIRLLQLEWAFGRATQTLGESRSGVADLLDEHGYRVYRPDRCGHLSPVEGEVPDVQDVFAAAPDLQLDPRLLQHT
jgi:FkbM family methyltransferase